MVCAGSNTQGKLGVFGMLRSVHRNVPENAYAGAEVRMIEVVEQQHSQLAPVPIDYNVLRESRMEMDERC